LAVLHEAVAMTATVWPYGERDHSETVAQTPAWTTMLICTVTARVQILKLLCRRLRFVPLLSGFPDLTSRYFQRLSDNGN
jgi:hypothetical protein